MYHTHRQQTHIDTHRHAMSEKQTTPRATRGSRPVFTHTLVGKQVKLEVEPQVEPQVQSGSCNTPPNRTRPCAPLAPRRSSQRPDDGSPRNVRGPRELNLPDILSFGAHPDSPGGVTDFNAGV